MTGIDLSSPPLGESLDYGQPLELGYFLGLDPSAPSPHARGVRTALARAPRVRGRNIAATARRLPGLQFSNQVADSDLPAEEDQQ